MSISDNENNDGEFLKKKPQKKHERRGVMRDDSDGDNTQRLSHKPLTKIDKTTEDRFK